MSASHEIHPYAFTVQFEDLDAGGIVHHPNYLRYCERARCDAMAHRGYSFRQCMADGSGFVVAEVLMRYLRPAQMDDVLYVLTLNAGFKKSSMKVFQVITTQAPSITHAHTPGEILRLPSTLFMAQIRLVHVDLKTSRPKPMGDSLRAAFGLPAEGNEASDSRFGDVRLQAEWDTIE